MMEDYLTTAVRIEDENAALRAILEGTATVNGERFFDALVANYLRSSKPVRKAIFGRLETGIS
jgi:hypothetical protein